MITLNWQTHLQKGEKQFKSIGACIKFCIELRKTQENIRNAEYRQKERNSFLKVYFNYDKKNIPLAGEQPPKKIIKAPAIDRGFRAFIKAS